MSRLARAAPLFLLLMVVASPVSADHCDGSMTMSPASGPPGTTFAFRTNITLGDLNLRLYRNGEEVRSTVRQTVGRTRLYLFRTDAADVGRWTAMAGEPSMCHSKLFTFYVGDLPTTDTRPTKASSSAAVLGLAGLAGGLLGLAVGTRGRKRALSA